MTTIFIIISIIVSLTLLKSLIKKKSDINSLNSKTRDINTSLELLTRRSYEKQIVKDYRGAIAITDKILNIQPNNYLALTCRANSLEALNYNLEAIDDYEKAILIDNSDPNIYGLLGIVYTKIGEIDKGISYLKISLQKGWKLYEVNYNLLSNATVEIKELMIKNNKVSKNLLRRNPNDFKDNLTPIDLAEIKESLSNQLHHLSYAISRDPDNKEFKELYEITKSQID